MSDNTLVSFGDIHITCMDQSAFIVGGTNSAHNWSTHSKNNAGIRLDASHVTLHHNISVIYDSDVIDAYIDDRDLKIDSGNDYYTGNTEIELASLNVVNLNQNSGVFMGNSSINGMDSHTKENFAMGEIRGYLNKSFYNTNVINDRDVMDATINDNDMKWI